MNIYWILRHRNHDGDEWETEWDYDGRVEFPTPEEAIRDTKRYPERKWQLVKVEELWEIVDLP